MRDRGQPVLFLVATFIYSCLSVAQAQSPKVASRPYTWKNVQIVGGGFVDGIIFHPKESAGSRFSIGSRIPI
jgi:hypothetical protein